MSETIKPHEAKKLREAFKNITDASDNDDSKYANEYAVHVHSSGAALLLIYKDGEVAATLALNNRVIKNIKKQMEFIRVASKRSHPSNHQKVKGKLVGNNIGSAA